MNTNHPPIRHFRLGRLRVLALSVLAAMLLLAATPSTHAAPQLSDERYKEMTPFERAQYDKAFGLFENNEYRAAAAEFGKFTSQYADCSQLSHMILMQGLSHHKDKKRNQAIKIYDQVLDFFGHVTADAAPALYYQGVAQIDNGDVLKGVATLREMVEDDRYRNHPYAAGALRRLADYYAREGELARAVTYWKQTLEDFGDTNEGEANRARANVTEYYIAKGDYEAYENWIVDEDKADDASHRRWVSDHAWGQAYHRRGQWHGYVGDNASVQQRRKDFWNYFTSRRPWWEKDGKTWDYYQHAVNYVVFRLGEDEALQEVLEAAVQHATSLDDEKARDDRLAWLADRIRRRGHYELARFCLDKMSDQLRATYGRYELLHQRKQWEDAANVLQQIIAADDGYWKRRAEGQLADLYRVRLGKQEEAIKLYRQINNPPGTIWKISDAFIRMGKFDEGLSMLKELEASFPGEAPKAAWKRVSLLESRDKDDLAVAEARKIMKKYPKSGESSKAHQFLEKRGYATGGAVIDES